MTDRVYPSRPSTKPNGTATNGTATATTNPLALPPAKSHLYNPNRHPYRPNLNPQRRRHRSRRSFFCCCCFWSILLIIAVLLLASIAGAALYVLYRPHRPTFSFTSLKISQFNLTTAADDSSWLTTKLNLTISSTNPNKKLVFAYDPIEIITFSSNQVQIAIGSFPSFTSNPKNVTYLHSSLYSSSQVLDADSVTSLRSDLKKKTGLPLKIFLDTQVIVKVDKLKSKKVGIRIKCEGIHASIPKGKSPSIASKSKTKCKVDLRIKIWKWTF